MYYHHFLLQENPFTLTPDPKYLLLSESHREALASMIYGVHERKGFVLLVGEVGTGKTTLVRHLLGQFGENITSAYIVNAGHRFDEFLHMTLQDLEIPCMSRERIDMIQALNTYLLKENSAGRYVVVIIDEAQRLSSSVLEELRMLTNLETASSKLLQIILVGQPEIITKLSRPRLRQVRQRIALTAELQPLTWSETKQYVTHRLQIAGYWAGQLFTRRALRKIYRVSGGIPRVINIICDKALVLGYSMDATQIDARIVQEAIQDWSVLDTQSLPVPRAIDRLGLLPGRKRSRKRRRHMTLAMGLVLLATGLLIGFTMQTLPSLWPRLSDTLRHIQTSGRDLARRGLQDLHTVTPSTPAIRETSQPKPFTQPPPSRAATTNHEPIEPPPPSQTETPPSAPAETSPLSQTETPPLSQTETPPLSQTETPPLSQTETPPPAPAEMPPPSQAEKPSLSPTTMVSREDSPNHSPPAALFNIIVRSGDSLTKLVRQRYGRVDALLLDFVKLANPHVENIDVIHTGQRLRLPPLNPGAMVHHDGNALYKVHVMTLPNDQYPQVVDLKTTLEALGHTVYVTPVRLTNNHYVWYRIMVGDFTTPQEAAQFYQRFQLSNLSIPN